jgi:quinol monooxygenase YgiN
MAGIHRQAVRALALGAAAVWVTFATMHTLAAKEKKMVVEYIRYEVPAAQQETFLGAYRAAAAELSAAPECLHYEIAQGVEEPNNFVVRIEWQSQEAHEHGFRQGPHFPPFFTKVKPFFSNIREMKHYRIAADGQGKGSAATGG